ncbi:MAG: RNA polymerase sporulation sigma factor SigK [Acutalibacteraceae bacterium]
MFESVKAVLQNILFFVLHIAGTGSFPKPLSASKEKQLLKEFKENGNLKARSELIEHNLRLVAHVIKKYYSNYSEQDDLISIGTIGLIKAIDSFDADKGTRLATYAARCIENEILMFFRSQKKNAGVMSINEPIDVDNEGNPLTLIDVIYADNTIVEDIDMSDKIKRLYEIIGTITDEREKEIISKRYGLFDNKELTQREIASQMGISRSYVSRIEKKVIEDLRRKFK